LDRRDELLLCGIYASVGSENIRAARPAEREENHVIVFSDEIFENRTPLFRTFHVTRSLACEQQRAADIGKCLKSRRLPARGRGHRLVELRQALVDISRGDSHESELCKCAKLQIGITGRER
jgi:hypothetical protein